MEILGIGPLEAIFIVLLALIAIGPRDLGTTARSLGRALNRLYRSEAWLSLTQASRNLRGLPNRLAREAALEELNQVRRELKDGTPPPNLPGRLSQPSAPAGGASLLPSPSVADPRQVGSERSDVPAPEPAAANAGAKAVRKVRLTKRASGAVGPRPVTRSPKRSSRAGAGRRVPPAKKRPPGTSRRRGRPS